MTRPGPAGAAAGDGAPVGTAPVGAAPVEPAPGPGVPPVTPGDGREGRHAGRAHRPRPQDWLVVAGLCLLTAWVAVVAVFFLPLHVGPVPLPISALLPVAVLVWAPRAAYRLTDRIGAAALVVLSWFGVSVFLVLVRNDLYLQYPVTVIEGQWRVMLLLGLGAVAAAGALGLLWGDHLRVKLAPRPVDPGTVGGAETRAAAQHPAAAGPGGPRPLDGA